MTHQTGLGAQIIDIDEIRLEGPSTTGGMTYDFVCDNGVATSGTSHHRRRKPLCKLYRHHHT